MTRTLWTRGLRDDSSNATRPRRLWRIASGVGGALAAGASLLAGEVLYVRRRVVLLDPPAGVEEAEFGPVDAPVLRLAVIGDSTAVGIGVERAEHTYPWLLGRRLGRILRVRLSVTGASGARMADISRRFAPAAAVERPDYVLIGAGANDVVHLTRMRTVGHHLADAIDLLTKNDARVFVALGPRFDPPLLPQPLRWLARRRSRVLNRTLERTARACGAGVIDVPTAIGDSFSKNPGRYYATDRFHPGEEGYAIWARVISEVLIRETGAYKTISTSASSFPETSISPSAAPPEASSH